MEGKSWIETKLSSSELQFFTYVDPEYIKDRFNLTGIDTAEWRLQELVDFLLSPDESSSTDEDTSGPEGELEAAAKQFYGMVHARYITTTRGQQKMMTKYINADFGRCPRALCRSQAVLPIGLHDLPFHSTVKLYCPKCEDIYFPAEPHNSLDSAFFGTSFPAMLFQTYPKQLPRRSNEQFCLKMFGFKIHSHAELTRWQQSQREKMEQRVREAGI